LRPHRRHVVTALAAAVVGSAISVAEPAIQRQIIDNVVVVHHSTLAPWLSLSPGAPC